jgi:tocopherol cyclase
MVASKNSINSSKYRQGAALKRNGVIQRRFLFSGFETETNTERMFFIELIFLNPWLSPDIPVLGLKSQLKLNPDDLQYALAGTQSAHDLLNEQLVQPSYVVVRAGVLGNGAKQLCRYYAAKSVKVSNKSFLIEADGCSFSDNHLTGDIACSPDDVIRHPEMLCSSGTIHWNLRYEILFGGFPAGYSGKNERWFAAGIQTAFAGSVTLDGTEYHVVSRTSFGSIDISWGKTYPVPYFHISASNLTSVITGKTLFNSCFAVHGIYNGRPSVLVSLEPNIITFTANSRPRTYDCLWECTLMPEDEQGEKLHWSVSVSNKTWVIDIDIFCESRQMFVRDFELPEGGHKMLKILCGGTGSGEIRLYKQIKKNLELIEHAHVEHAFCEYGQNENQIK